MSEKWNIVAFGGNNRLQALEDLQSTSELTDRSVIVSHSSDVDYLWFSGYRLDNDSAPYWVLKHLKTLSELPEWGVVVHGNDTEEGGRAFVLRNHDGFFDLLDVVLGHGGMYLEDVQHYLTTEHNISVPVWQPSNPADDAVSPANIGKEMLNIPEATIQEALDRYPLFEINGYLTDPIDSTAPQRTHDVSPSDETRYFQLTDKQFNFYNDIVSLTSLSSDKINSLFDEGNTFYGTYDEFDTYVRKPLYDWGMSPDVSMAEVADARRIWYQAALDWHNDS